jgi:hypothetical protein
VGPHPCQAKDDSGGAEWGVMENQGWWRDIEGGLPPPTQEFTIIALTEGVVTLLVLATTSALPLVSTKGIRPITKEPTPRDMADRLAALVKETNFTPAQRHGAKLIPKQTWRYHI